MVNLLKRHPLISFFVVTYAISWILFLPGVAISQGWLDPSFGLLRVLSGAGNFGPTIAAFVLTAILYHRPGVRALLNSARPERITLRMIVAALLLPIGIRLVALLAVPLATRIDPPAADYPWYFAPIVFLVVLITAGIAEEFGWRGFALPHLQQRWSALISSLILGVVWACWHLPAYLISGSVQQNIPVVSYIFGVIGYTIVLTWLFNASHGSVLAVILMHTVTNTAHGYFQSLWIGDVQIHSLVTWFVALALIALAGAQHLSQRRVEELTSIDPASA